MLLYSSIYMLLWSGICYLGVAAVVRKISVSDQAYELLNKLREELGTSTHSETILVLADRARLCSDIEPRLRKLELLLARLLEELTGGSSGEGPESPAGHGEGGDDRELDSRPVRRGQAAYPPETPRGREPQEELGETSGE